MPSTFQYETLKTSDKAVYAKVPYWEKTTDKQKKHKQLYYECWIPQSVIDKGTAKQFVIGKRNEMRLKNSYQRRCNMPESWNTLGEYAPVKEKVIVQEIDMEKLVNLKLELMKAHGATNYDHNFFISPLDSVTDEVEALAKAYRNPKFEDTRIPKMNVTYYR